MMLYWFVGIRYPYEKILFQFNLINLYDLMCVIIDFAHKS